jgi:excisionase family DNA binding protein
MLSRALLTTHEVAELLKVNEATVRAWIKACELRAFHLGREWRIAQVDLEAFLNAHANRLDQRSAAAAAAPHRPPHERET